MTELPPVTIGIPFYNAEDTLEDAVKSVFAQTHTAWELILIDDGSTDDSLEIARSIKDSRVKVYSDGNNKRLAARLNELADLAQYNYIARMDADDLMLRERLETQLKHLLENDGCDLVSAGLISVTDDLTPTGVRCVQNGHIVTTREVMLGRSGIVHPATLGKTQWFRENQYNSAFGVGQDTDLWIRSSARRSLKIHVSPSPLLFYREDGNVTFRKLSRGYVNTIRSIISEAENLDRALVWFACLLAFGKLMIILGMHASGQLGILRARRNAMALNSEERERFISEIATIRSIVLPKQGNPI